jgi:AraC-like DNA-binding protein
VRYESPSQFSREYSHLFGAPPQRDITRMRLVPVVAAGSARRTPARSTGDTKAPRRRSTQTTLASR